MKKLRVTWVPDINQDIDTVTEKNSPFYDDEITQRILSEHGSIENFKIYMNEKM